MNNGANAQRQATTARAKRAASQTTLETYTDLDAQAVTEVSSVLRRLLADVFTLYLKTKNFHWHMTGRHFRDYHSPRNNREFRLRAQIQASGGPPALAQ